MAAGVMFKIGEPVTCDQECGHRDCAASRKMAATPCHLCQKLIEPGRRYYREDDGRLVHEACLEATE